MTLAFMTKLDGKPTYFIEKIWQSFPDEKTADIFSYYLDGMDSVHYNFSCDAIDMREKIHTIRLDKSKRWKVGNKIHFVINNRTPKRYQFAPIVIVKSVQDIKITEMLMTQTAYCTVSNNKIFKVEIDGRVLHKSEVEKLAFNDGFENVDAFFNYFNEDFKGSLIHWTEHEY